VKRSTLFLAAPFVLTVTSLGLVTPAGLVHYAAYPAQFVE
jgi:hypothetical protein